jgi:hypothetical protein
MTNRRDFLNLMGLGFAGMAGRSWIPAVAQSTGANDADLVVFNAKVYTVDPHMPSAEAFAVKGGRFLAVGGTADM